MIGSCQRQSNANAVACPERLMRPTVPGSSAAYFMFYSDKDGGKRCISRSGGTNEESEIMSNNFRLACCQRQSAFVMIWR